MKVAFFLGITTAIGVILFMVLAGMFVDARIIEEPLIRAGYSSVVVVKERKWFLVGIFDGCHGRDAVKFSVIVSKYGITEELDICVQWPATRISILLH